MALSVLRKGALSLRGVSGRCLAAPSSVLRPQVATIVCKALRDKEYTRPAPFNYKNDEYGLFAQLFDKTTHRFDENSKIIVVDGPIAAGKTKFAKEIAEELDMLYIPQANMDMIYINSYGYDMRQLDPQFPEQLKSYDEKNFLQNPSHTSAANFQFHMFRLRLGQYIDALTHLLNTGQGVVMDRSVYGDFVFVEAMTKFGYMSKGARNMYYECKKVTVPELMRPHLVIYLDVPVDIVQQKAKANFPDHANSPVFSKEFLSQMAAIAKQQYLKEASVHSQLLVYDWSETGDTEVVVEDIERLNFDFDKNDLKMSDWRLPDEATWCQKRMFYSGEKDKFFLWMNVPNYDVPELIVKGDDLKKFYDVWESAPGMQYAKGFNEDMGDAFIATKVKVET